MAVGCNWMQDCLKLVSLWPDTMFPLQAREFQWGSVSVNGSTNSSSPPCPAMGSWSKRCLIFTMGGEPSRPCSLTKIWKILTISQKTPCSQSPTAIVYPLPVHRGARHPAQDGERLYALVVGRKTSLPCGLSITHTQRGLLYKIPIAGVPTRSVERRLWQIACQWVWNLRLTLGKMMQGGELREMEWAPPTETAPLFFTWEDPPEEYGPWQCAGEAGRAVGRFTADALTFQEGGELPCPAGARPWVCAKLPEKAFYQPGRYLTHQHEF